MHGIFSTSRWARFGLFFQAPQTQRFGVPLFMAKVQGLYRSNPQLLMIQLSDNA
ncbi:MAG TPA: hypothetical protein PKC76_14305 [Saprospiraceae bacterium]|nr:hypothetical protein [Saprospiraceae bacterium]HMP25303.1 hypothetical protein [Saprospiraceae bacterium]